jgi:hypothetical protein
MQARLMGAHAAYSMLGRVDDFGSDFSMALVSLLLL